jgi:hypothetical protein
MQVLAFESNYLEALPSAEMYERSYMHRDEIHHVVVSTDGNATAVSAAVASSEASATAGHA